MRTDTFSVFWLRIQCNQLIQLAKMELRDSDLTHSSGALDNFTLHLKRNASEIQEYKKLGVFVSIVTLCLFLVLACQVSRTAFI